MGAVKQHPFGCMCNACHSWKARRKERSKRRTREKWKQIRSKDNGKLSLYKDRKSAAANDKEE